MSIAQDNRMKELAAMVLDLQARVAALEAGPHAEMQSELEAHTAPDPDYPGGAPRPKRTYLRKAQPQ